MRWSKRSQDNRTIIHPFFIIKALKIAAFVSYSGLGGQEPLGEAKHREGSLKIRGDGIRVFDGHACLSCNILFFFLLPFCFLFSPFSFTSSIHCIYTASMIDLW